jgi:hypothetical protein
LGVREEVVRLESEVDLQAPWVAGAAILDFGTSDVEREEGFAEYLGVGSGDEAVDFQGSLFED